MGARRRRWVGGGLRPQSVSSAVVRGLTRRWIYRVSAEAARAEPSSLVQRVLTARGLTGPDAIRRFCEPKLTDLHDPGLLPNIERAVLRLVEAVRGDQHIVIYGDYDVDGITASAILYYVIKAVAPDADVRTYVPHRLDEGYGLSGEALRQLRSEGAELVISVDCGITATEPARVAREIGLDLIITDHHRPPQEASALPDAFAIVHPGLAGSMYPFSELCGAGVAYKLAWLFATVWCGSKRVGKSLQETLLHLLPLAALGTIADVVPLVDENRVMATFGLRWMKQTPIVGLRALIEASGLMGEHIDSEKVGFVLGPRLNACGRMGHAAEALRLLTTASAEEAAAIAGRLTQLNRQRQQTERTICEHAAQMAEDSGMTADNHRAIILADESWHRGVIGVVCSRIVDRFGRPTILLQRQGDTCKGSARSINGYSMYDALSACSDHLLSFGGHDGAAGLSVATANLPAFTEAFVEHANAHVSAEQLTPAVDIDCDATLGELDMDTVKQIAALSPFGRSNPRPALRIEQATLAEAPRQIGTNGRHLTLRLHQDLGASRKVVRTVWWDAGALAADLAAGMRLDVVIEPKINTWNGRTSVEGEIKDVRVCEV